MNNWLVMLVEPQGSRPDKQIAFGPYTLPEAQYIRDRSTAGEGPIQLNDGDYVYVTQMRNPFWTRR